MDRIDQKILLELQADARLSIVELSRRVGLTKTPCAERVRRLEKTGVIRGYHAALDPDAVGAGHIVVVQVLLTSTTEHDLRRFNEAVRRIPEIESCHMIAGDFDYNDFVFGVTNVTNELPAVPLPAALPLMASAFGGFALFRRRRG